MRIKEAGESVRILCIECICQGQDKRNRRTIVDKKRPLQTSATVLYYMGIMVAVRL